MNEIVNNYLTNVNEDGIDRKVRDLTGNITSAYNVPVLKQIFSFMDLTYLEVADFTDKIINVIKTINSFNSNFPDMPNVASVCVFPTLVKTVKENLKINDVNISSVVGAFPYSQTFQEIKIAETKKTVEAGANEIDIVFPVGIFLSEDYDTVFNNIKEIKDCIGNAKLKVILETGALQNMTNIKIASVISMQAGADFIQTSTGKTEPHSSLNDAYIIATAIKEFFDKTGKKVGIKPAGDISDPETVLRYYIVIKKTLGEEWLNKDLFRFGAKDLANNILTTINKMTTEDRKLINHFLS
jgi:deoxyribose-phosphate aldolase